jgi:Tfp pilus assembly protein PilV
MLQRARDQDGFLMIEVSAAIVVLSIALLALMAGYDSAFVSLHKSSQKAVAATLANQQLERYSALPYASVGLNATLVSNVGTSTNPSYDASYATNSILDGTWSTDPVTGNPVQAPSGTVNDVTVGACASDTTSPNCLPIQSSVLGSDGKHYRIETFIRDDINTSSNIRWTTRDVTVIVRDADLATQPQLVSMATGFDRAAAG